MWVYAADHLSIFHADALCPMKQSIRDRELPAFALAFVGVVGLAFNIWFAELNRAGWGLDFNQFYSAGRLAGTGHLYDWDALRTLEIEHGIPMPTGRLPVVLFGHRILSNLPYAQAQYVWLAASIAALLVFAMAWPGAQRLLMVVALAWSMPLTLVLLYGQDVPFWLMFFAAGLLLMQRKRPWIAGIAFSLCICKFHLALGIPIMLAAQKRWRTMIAGAISFAALIALSFLIEGPGWLREYVKMSHLPEFSPAAARMPTLYGLASWLPGTEVIEIAAAVGLVLLLWTACREGTDLGTAGAAAAACGILLAHHSYAGDCGLLIPLAVLTIQRQGMPPWLNIGALLVLLPIPVLLLVTNKSFLAQILIAGFVVAAMVFVRKQPLRADQQEHGHVPGH